MIVGKNFNDKPSVRDLNKIKNDEMILDIGPKTIEEINDLINKSKTVLWNGPAGYCENPDFAKLELLVIKNSKIYQKPCKSIEILHFKILNPTDFAFLVPKP